MASWQAILVLWVVLWALQSVGVWYQTRYYAQQMKSLQADHQNGYFGTGHSKRRLGKGSIVMIVMSRDMLVRRFVSMRGATVFAKFCELPEFHGLDVAQLQERLELEPKKSSLRDAATSALDQILRVKRDRASAELAIPALVHA